ncbi:replication factor A protein 3 [Mycena sp. CBHHK59/15]|nr:replication factor A protein 3 [Mycena sp. CBHHK59/15]
MSDQQLISTRVNSALLPRFTGKSVRLACRPVKFMGATATVVASDGGEVTIMLMPDTHMSADTYWEVIGSVVNATTLRVQQAIKMGSDLDMKLVDDTINLIHDPRFYTKMFMPED